MSSNRAKSHFFVAICILFTLSVCAGVWEFLALQAPYTLGSIASLRGPVSQLRSHVMWLCLDAVALFTFCSHIKSLSKSYVYMFFLGAFLLVIALFVAALRNMLAIQLDDPRTNTLWPVLLRLAGYLLLVLAHIGPLRQVWREMKEASFTE